MRRRNPMAIRTHCEPGSLTRSVMDETLRRARQKASIAIEAASNETVKQVVAAGFGIAFMSAHAIAQEIELKRLAVLDVGTILFGNDGFLYAGGGDGASFNNADWGQFGNSSTGDKVNPCGDPPGGVARE